MLNIKKVFAKLLPMKYIQYEFTDSVSGDPVNLYKQVDGKLVLSNSRWCLFRVPTV